MPSTSFRPIPPTPMHAMLSLSLGATNPLPPRTCLGTIVNAVAPAAAPTKSRRFTASGIDFSIYKLGRLLNRRGAEGAETTTFFVVSAASAPLRFNKSNGLSPAHRSEEHGEDQQDDECADRGHLPDPGPVVRPVGQAVCAGDAAGHECADEVADAVGDEVDESLRRRTDTGSRLLVGINLTADEEEVVADAVKQDACVDEPHAGTGIARREREVSQRPRRHAGEHDRLDTKPLQEEWEREHERDLGHLPERLDEGRVGRADLVEKKVREGVVELQRNAEEER